MKLEKQHIDDLFRDNLSGFAPEPAASSWKKISIRLLWKEIAHFRFGNVPKAWYGITAAGLIGLSVFFTMMISEQPETAESVAKSLSGEVSETSTGQNEIDYPALQQSPAQQHEIELDPLSETKNENEPPTVTQIDGSDITKVEAITENFEVNKTAQNLFTRPEVFPEPAVSDEITLPSQPVEPVKSPTDDGIINDDGLSNNAQSVDGVTPVRSVSSSETISKTFSAKESLKNTPTEVVRSKTQSLNNSEAKPFDKSSGLEIQKTDKSTEPFESLNEKSETNIGSSNLNTGNLDENAGLVFEREINDRQTEITQKIGSIEANKFDPLQGQLVMIPGKAETINHSVTESVIAGRISALNKKLHTSSGKVQKVSTRNSILASIFKGEYKPPRRSFQDPITAMYGGPKPYYTLSAYFSPEITEYARIASESRERSYYGGLALSYNTSRFVIQSGIEYSSFRDLGDYMVNMSTYDSVGYYYDIVGFEIDPNNPDSIIFETHTVAVWDSVQHHSHQQTNNNYTYLQVPFLIGYKAMDRGLFSAHLKAGPSFSFMLNRKEPSLDFQMPGATINSIDNYTAPRLNTNIQLLVSLALHVQLTEKFGLLVEPTYRYYINTVYEINNESLSNPYGISIKSGLFYNF
jgi:hypothetical protein